MQLQKYYCLKIILCCLAVTCFFAANAQTCPDPFLGSKTLYRPPLHSQAAPPKGYLPVFINHVARHGARHVTSDVNGTIVYQLLEEADSADALTMEGKQLKLKIGRLEKLEKQHFKSISEEGKLEQIGLADRLYEGNKGLFASNSIQISVDYTKEVRTLQTSEAFLNELKIKIPKTTSTSITSQVNDTSLRFYDFSPAYLSYKRKGDWLLLLDSLRQSFNYASIATETAARFFTAGFLNTRMNQNDQQEFTKGLFGFITILYSLQQEIKMAGYTMPELDIQSYFSCKQLGILSEIDNAEDYLQKGPAMDVNGIQVRIAAPLLQDFIVSTDDYLKTKKTPLCLRFCHAETIAPFAALLAIEKAAAMATAPHQISQVWQAENIIPLSANIQWIVYQSKENPVTLIKFLLNEKEVAVKGLATNTFPFYDWADVRSFYLKKLAALQLAPNQNKADWFKQLR